VKPRVAADPTGTVEPLAYEQLTYEETLKALLELVGRDVAVVVGSTIGLTDADVVAIAAISGEQIIAMLSGRLERGVTRDLASEIDHVLAGSETVVFELQNDDAVTGLVMLSPRMLVYAERLELGEGVLIVLANQVALSVRALGEGEQLSASP
jgi:hypothetical protein